jgi:sugar-specific transcriptional regulator TrmB|tara:strand:+ start:259 stop:423 length:165 start_codon:yes stop_codon:yes gene_type:complete
MSKEIISKLDELDNGLKKLSTERKVVLPHHKTFELVDELREIVENIKNEVGANE